MNQRESQGLSRVFRCDPKGFVTIAHLSGLPNSEAIEAAVAIR
jgi:hypothetical protein